MVKAPGYKVEDCKGVRSDVSSKVVERVKKVVSGINFAWRNALACCVLR